MKKGIKLICSSVALLMLFSSCYINREPTVKKTITVNGSATITSNPDIATIDFTVVSYGWSAKQIVQDNDTIANRLSETVKKVGVSENDILISDCTITNPSNQYEARRNVRVTVRNINLVSAVVDCKSGASMRLKGIEYGLADSAAVLRRARSAAIQQAQDSASLLAGASGCKISEAMEITEEKTSSSVQTDGKINVISEVKVTYLLQ